MSVVKQLALGGITVCATIHSPTPYAFGLFDSLLLLASGRSVYFGPMKGAVDAMKAASASFSGEWDAHAASDSEYLSDVMQMSARLGHEDELVGVYEASDLRARTMDELERQLEAPSIRDGDRFKEMMAVRKATTTPSWWALWVLFRYRTLKAMADMQFYGQHVFPWVIQTVIIGSTFWFIASVVRPDAVTSISAIIFFWVCTTAFGAAAYVPAVILAKPILAREVADGLYRPVTFLTSLLVEEIIIAIPTTLAINVAMWFALQLAGSFIAWFLTFFIAYVTGILVSYAICAFAPGGISGLNIANAAVPIYGVICLFFSGFLISVNSIGWWWRWLVYACPTFWGFSAQMNNFWREGTDRAIPYLGSPSVPAHFGVDVLGPSPWPYIGMQCVFPVVFFLLAAVGFNRTRSGR